MTPRFDPEIAARLASFPTFDLADIPALRRWQGAPPADTAGVAFSTMEVERPDGSVLLLAVYAPAVPPDERPVGCVFDIHGGGFVFGTALDARQDLVDLVRELGIVVASVEYRLAPEHPFPAAIEDCYTGLVAVVERADRLGIDPDRIAVQGMSAGGGLAASLALMVRDRDGPSLCFQYLGFAILDDRLSTPSMRRFVDTPGWSLSRARISWDCYLGPGTAGGPDVSPYAAPARAASLAGLPPAYVSAMEFDPLRDEGIDYAARLLSAGVPCELHVFPGAFHGSRGIRSAAVSRREVAEHTTVLRNALTAR